MQMDNLWHVNQKHIKPVDEKHIKQQLSKCPSCLREPRLFCQAERPAEARRTVCHRAEGVCLAFGLN